MKICKLKICIFTSLIYIVIADVLERFDNIIKPPTDGRLYRGLQLSNHMRVLLISDPTTDKSAASMAIGVGSFNDPEGIPGLAYLLGRILPSRTKKYPQENGFRNFLHSHDGNIMVYTNEEEQNIFFEVDPNYLGAALDGFAQLFLDPLIEESSIENEVAAMDVEHLQRASLDNWRFSQVAKSISKPNHPYGRFHTGNLETLYTLPKSRGISVYGELLAFYSKWYSSNLMRLAVVGKENLNELEKMVISLFENVEDKKVEKLVFPFEQHPWGTEQLGKLVYIVPILDLKQFKFSFPVPDMHDQYKTAPAQYVSYLIEQETPCEFFTKRRGRVFCEYISTTYSIYSGIGFFNIQFDVKDEDAIRNAEVISLLFQFINFLRTDGIKEWIFEKKKKLNAMYFSTQYNESSASYVKSITSSMDNYPIQDILSFKFIQDRWDPTPIEEFLSYLRPDNMNMFTISKFTAEKIAVKTERWYGAKYEVKKIPTFLIENWREREIARSFPLRPPNEFIPENFNLFPVDKQEPKNPYVIHESPLSRIWFKQDNEFKLPKLSIQFELLSPISNLDPYNSAMKDMFVFQLKESIEEDAYALNEAGIEWDIGSTKSGILVRLFGYNDKLTVLLQKIMSNMTNMNLNEVAFINLKNSYIQYLKTFDTEQVRRLATHYLSHLLSESDWSKDERRTAYNFCKSFFTEDLFSRVFIHALIHGNCNHQNAVDIINIIQTPFKLKNNPLPQQLVLPREIKLKDGDHFVYEVFNEHQNLSFYCVYFQCCTESIFHNALMNLFSTIIQEPCHVLQEQEQFGNVICAIRRVSGVLGSVFFLTSEKHPLYVDSRIEEFLLNLDERLADMTEEEFQEYKLKMATELEKPKQLEEISDLYWSEISTQIYNFDRIDIEMRQLNLLKKADILDLYKEMFNIRRRKLEVHVISTVTKPEIPENVQREAYKITDITAFKNSMNFFPLPPPYITIAPLGGPTHV